MSKAQPKGKVDTTTASDGEQTSGDGSTKTETIEPSDDEVFELLANQRRRFVLHYLRCKAEASVSLSTLSERVAGWENDAEPAELAYSERKSVRNSLHQFHLPKLADAGIVEYDDRASEISLQDPVVVDAYHTVAADGETVPQWTFVAGASAGAVGVLALAAIAADLVGGVVPWALVALAAATVTVAGYYGRRTGVDVDGAPPECGP
jgi:hypothetical protein